MLFFVFEHYFDLVFYLIVQNQLMVVVMFIPLLFVFVVHKMTSMGNMKMDILQQQQFVILGI